MKVKSKAFLNTTFAGFILLSPTYGRADQRFDGTWVGTETITPTSALTAPASGAGSGTSSMMHSLVQQHPAKIIITQNGTLLAIAEGHCPGCYNNVRRSGNVLKVEAGDCKMEIVLSVDGNTLIEKGTATKGFPWANGNVHFTKRLPVQIAGAFHKQ